MPDERLIDLEDVTFSYWQDYEQDFEPDREKGPKGAPESERGRKLEQGRESERGRENGQERRIGPERERGSEPAPGGALERDNAVDGVCLSVRKGEFVVLLGRNGSGKSTIAKLLNALLLPTGGAVLIKGRPTTDADYVWEVRRTSGMVFQNPDNQIVGTTVEEDVAFGVENLGVPPPEIRSRVRGAMEATAVLEFSQRPPYQLSGGQKQRVAIAGILAMKPECIILDEATAMLDPDGRREVLRLVRELNAKDGITVIHITHHMDEVAEADRVYVVDGGKVVMEGTPREIFSDVAAIKRIGLEVPQVTDVFEALRERGFALPRGVIGIGEAVAELEAAIGSRFAGQGAGDGGEAGGDAERAAGDDGEADGSAKGAAGDASAAGGSAKEPAGDAEGAAGDAEEGASDADSREKSDI
ncbi:MAG: energy-coupling factor transporter ATPase [Clostridiales bacterium]|nr:energy-coupling factor transporter ATPase [Clostridiales bacterium]